jgi:hydrogenase maturation factor
MQFLKEACELVACQLIAVDTKLVEGVCVDDFVGVALLGQESLAVLSKILVHGIAAD